MLTTIHEQFCANFLVLVPSSLNEELGFENSLLELLLTYEEQKLPYEVLVESEKNSRRRWIKSGLNRDKISQFILYNEHTQEKENSTIIQKMVQGIRFILICDEGLPTFFDPGQQLVSLMHKKKLKVGCLSLPCSPILGLVLSGFESTQFRMLGFPPVKTQERDQFFKDMVKIEETVIVMDTAYRLKLTLEQLAVVSSPTQNYFLGLDLARPHEQYFVGTLSQIMQLVDFEQKKDFVLIKASKNEK